MNQQNYRRKTTSSKTDRIAEVFTENPTVTFSPKQIAHDLDLDLQLVTSIVKRLMDEGMLERVDRGKYRLRSMLSVDMDELFEISREMDERASRTIGKELDSIQPFTIGKDPLDQLNATFGRIRDLGGKSFAVNLFRMSAKKRMKIEDMNSLLEKLMGDRGVNQEV